MSRSTLMLSLGDSTTVHDAVLTPSRSSEEVKQEEIPAGKNREGDEIIAVEEEKPGVELEYPDGGWRAWGVIFGVSRFLPVDTSRN
jgi:hypothetical protein